jgi:aryl-alcohol dehydrogenase (NADP+)
LHANESIDDLAESKVSEDVRQSMEYVNLGSTGIRVSRICLGTMTYGSKQWREWMLEEEEALPFFRHAIEAGINFFDTADMYSVGRSEEITGKALREFGPGREKVVIATKVFNKMSDDPNDQGLSRKHIMHSIDRSLRRLGTDYVDLYQIHRYDTETPIEETLEALDDVVRSGKALYIGASSMYAWQFLKMLEFSRQNGLARFVTMQNHYNLVYREEEREMIPLCRAEKIGLLPWSPLARGFLTGSRQRGDDKGETVRAQADAFCSRALLQAIRLHGRGSGDGTRAEARSEQCPDRACVAARAARCHRAYHRCQQALSPG